MTNKAALNYPTEGEEQATLFSWARMYENKYPQLKWMFHIPNEGKRSWATGGRMRSEGMKSGVADIFLPAPSGEYHGLFIELKRLRGGKRTEKQEEFIAAMNAACFCAGWMAAVEVIVGYLEGDFTWKQ